LRDPDLVIIEDNEDLIEEDNSEKPKVNYIFISFKKF
jgi:hypothetical protein